MDLNELPTAPFRRHPWEVARARFFGGVVAAAGAGQQSGAGAVRVLDVGAGDGSLARLAVPPLPGLLFSRSRPLAAFDVVLLLDVIEHVADDRAFLDEILESCVPPGD